ncbi:MAG: hypothetical protein ACO3L7_07625 [Poseidonia sp.]|jgi:hypothetical protein
MARKKGGFGRFLGSITGTPYEKLLKQVEKAVEELEDDDKALGKRLRRLVDETGQKYEDEEIDEEEHDLVIEAIEEADPKGRTFGKFSDDDSFYAGDIPDAPELKGGKKIDLDDLMQAKGDEFLGSFGRDEFDEFRDKMTEDFFAEADAAIAQGDHEAEIRTEHRVFGGAESDVEDVKRRIAQESDIPSGGNREPAPAAPEPEYEDEAEDDGYSVDEDGTEWFEDEEGYWWYRPEGENDWIAYEE